MNPTSTSQDESINHDSGGFAKFFWIGISAAISGIILKWTQNTGDTNVIYSTIIHTFGVLFPAGITYLLVTIDQAKKLDKIIKTINEADLSIKDLKRVSEIEKYQFANERIIDLEKHVINDAISSMQEITDITSAFNDELPHTIKLKERLRTHAKSILTLHKTFTAEVSNNISAIVKTENEYAILTHQERQDLVFIKGKELTHQTLEHHGLPAIDTSITRINEQLKEIGALADQKTQEFVKKLDNSSTKEV